MTVVLFKLQCFFFFLFSPQGQRSLFLVLPQLPLATLGVSVSFVTVSLSCCCLLIFYVFLGTICAVSPQLLRRNCYINRCNPQGAGQIGSTPSGWFTRKCSQGIQAQEHLAPGDPKKVRFGYSLLKKSQFQGTSGGETNGELIQRPTPEIQHSHQRPSIKCRKYLQVYVRKMWDKKR